MPETDIDCGFSLTYLQEHTINCAHKANMSRPKSFIPRDRTGQCGVSSSCFLGSWWGPGPKLPDCENQPPEKPGVFLNKTMVKWTKMGLEARVFVKQGLAGLNKVTPHTYLRLLSRKWVERKTAITLFLAAPDGHVHMPRTNHIKTATEKSRH